MIRIRQLAAISIAIALAACSKPEEAPAPVAADGPRPSILLVTLDTTRFDAVGPEAKSVSTPAFNALVARGRSYRYAYATTPQTLPSHSSMMTGLYPAGHGVHENGRYLGAQHPLVAEELKAAGYDTAAFVSAFAVARRFGLARGFDVYDDDFGRDRAQRPAIETTDKALAHLPRTGAKPLFVWVHYYDPHYPYEPPAPFGAQYAKQPYFGEIAAMDQQLGRLVAAFEKIAGPKAIIVLADHGEGLGDHGEAQHGNLLYQATMRVPLVIAGPGVGAGVENGPVSTRRVYHTIRDWAGIDATNSLRKSENEVVVGEAMKPFLDYGWQPQVMVVEGTKKAILAGKVEAYDVAADPAEARDLGDRADLSRAVRATLKEYPLPSTEPPKAVSAASEEERRKLASLGYVASTVKPVVRADAPRPVEMAHLFPILDRASGLFVREQYAEAIPLLEEIRRADPYNLDAALRLATAHSSLGHYQQALEAYERAQAIAPKSRDVRAYMALHLARGAEWERAAAMLEQVLAEEPERVPALEGLAVIRERQQRFAEAAQIRERLYTLRTPTEAELARLAATQMELGQTAAAIASFEKVRALEGDRFRHDLELGVLYLATRRFEDARTALDRVPANHPGRAMALFKRAQVSVLLNEPDRMARIEAAKRAADATTRELIARERLFR
jgi:arylsulfatase A-like enzyme/Tfp pilus assembly protein PilF